MHLLSEPEAHHTVYLVLCRPQLTAGKGHMSLCWEGTEVQARSLNFGGGGALCVCVLR